MNKYIDECEPCNLEKDESKKDRISTVMYNLVDSLYKISMLIYPFMPNTAEKIVKQLGLNIDFNTLKLEDIRKWGSYPAGNKLDEAVPLFPRIEIEPENKKDYNENLHIENPITINDFNKVEIKVVEIMKVEKIKDADKLLKFIVDTGTEKRQIVSGIAKWYPDEKELIGKKVTAVLNLEPVTLKGELSQGMLLTTIEKKKNRLIEINKEVKTGSIVK